MKRRNFLVGAGGVSLGGSLLLGSGAFSRVESDRAVSIAVAEDPDAYLGLDKCPDSPNGSYAHLDDKGHLKIYMDEDNPTRDDTPLGAGVNSNSRTWFHNVFQICNQGKEQACVWIDDDEYWPTVPEGYPGAGERRVEFYLGDNDGTTIIGEENAIPLDVGSCVCIGIKTRTHGLSDGDELLGAMDNQITINADVGLECEVVEPDELKYDIHLAYQDQDASEGGDYDYNDWLVDINATFTQAEAGDFGIRSTRSTQSTGVKYLDKIDMEFVPLAKSAGLEHKFHLIDDNGIINGSCPGNYTLEVIDENGVVVRDDAGSFNGGDETITIFESTEEVFDPEDSFKDGMWNAGPDQEECAEPILTAELELDFDHPCAFDFDAFDPVGDPSEPHGQDLFFNPELSWDGGGPVERGDLELLTVPDGWAWPIEEASIWDVYEDVDEDDGEPVFPEDEWRPPLEFFDGDEDLVFDVCNPLPVP